MVSAFSVPKAKRCKLII